MRSTRQEEEHKRKQQKQRHRTYSALCCSSATRFSVSSSSEESDTSKVSEHYASLSSLTHLMVQQKLDQMIKEKQEASHREVRKSMRRRRRSHEATKFILMVAMEKSSYDPRQDFRDSMIEMILANRIEESKDLRSLMEYYLSLNSEDYHPIILQAFHEVCADLFLC